MVSWRDGTRGPRFLMASMCSTLTVSWGWFDLLWHGVAGIDYSGSPLCNSGNKRGNILLELCAGKDPTQFNELAWKRDPNKHKNKTLRSRVWKEDFSNELGGCHITKDLLSASPNASSTGQSLSYGSYLALILIKYQLATTTSTSTIKIQHFYIISCVCGEKFCCNSKVQLQHIRSQDSTLVDGKVTTTAIWLRASFALKTSTPLAPSTLALSPYIKHWSMESLSEAVNP